MTGVRGNRAGVKAASRIPAVAATLAAPALLYLIFKVAAAGMGPVSALAVAPLPPADPVPLMRQLIAQAQNQKARIGPYAVATARQGLADSPLAFEPFFIAARAEEQAGRLPRALTLMEEARRRRPTFAPNRMQLLVYYAQAQRFDGALRELDVLLRRNPELQKLMLPEVVKFMKDQEGREALASLLAKDPEWREPFFQVASQQKVDPADARRLFALVQAQKRGGSLDLERQLILQAQVSLGEYDGARMTALAALPDAERAKSRFLVDGEFQGVKILKPFGWDFKESEAGRSELSREGGRSFLDVTYFGGSDVVLAEQTLALAPGRYNLSSVVRGQGGGNGARVSWQVKCAFESRVFVTLELTSATANATRLGATFNVPRDCAGQSLRLVGEAGEVASTLSMQIHNVELSQ